MLTRVLEAEVMDTAEMAMAYETMDHAGPNAAVVNRLEELGARGLMLDLGTGPGHIPLAICERWREARVIGVDMSFEMLRIAQRHRLGSGLAGRIAWVAADIKRLPLGSRSFDTVFSNTTLHHLPEPVELLREGWRVLGEGGVMMIRDLYRPQSVARRDELVELYAGQNTPLQRRLLCQSLHAALSPRELLEAARRAGIVGARVTIDSDRHMTLQCRKEFRL